MIVYKPIEESDEPKLPKYITTEDLDERLKNIDIGKELKEDVKSLKKQMKDFTYDLQKLNQKLDEGED